MRKFLTKTFLSEHGYGDMNIGREIVSYCETCSCQRSHKCTGKKEDNGNTIYRFVCGYCNAKLGGGVM